MQVRLQKYLADCGVASRRQCEEWMRQGRVMVDGRPAVEPGTKIDPEVNQVTFNGQPVSLAKHRYIALHKPPGFVCTSHDPQGRPKVVDIIPAGLGRLYTIGRLDSDSEGLILLTNDGAFAHRLAHPRHHVEKSYELWLNKPLSESEQRLWLTGINDRDEKLSVLKLKNLPKGKDAHGYQITLGEGRNRHLRRMAEHSGKKVLRLKRVAIGPLKIGDMKRSAWRELSAREIALLSGDAHGCELRPKSEVNFNRRLRG